MYNALVVPCIFRQKCVFRCCKIVIIIFVFTRNLGRIVLPCKMWAATYWQLHALSVGICGSFPVGKFSGMDPVKYMDFPPANTFPVPCGCVYPVSASGNFNAWPLPKIEDEPSSTSVELRRWPAGHYQNFKGDHPRSLYSSPARKVKAVSSVPTCSFNNGHPQNYKGRPRSLSALPRNMKTALQRSSRP